VRGDAMELTDAVRRRRMVRSYDPRRPVAAAALEAIVHTALRAPSAGFTQGTSLLLLSTPVDRSAFWQATAAEKTNRWLAGMQTAPVLMVVWTSREDYLDRYAESDKGWSDRDLDRWSAPYWFVDAGMASMGALLSAVDAGLGACFFGIPPDRVAVVRETFGVPVEQLFVGVVAVGYPDPDAAPLGSPRRRPRKPVGQLLHRGRW